MTSVVRPLPSQLGSSIFSRAPSSFSGRMAESRQGSTLQHDVEPTEIGRRRALALANLILVVRCASHLLLSVLFAYIRQRVRGEQHILRGEAKIVLTLTLIHFLALKATAHTTRTKIMCCDIACDIAFVACDLMQSHAITTIAAIANLKKLY